MYELTNVWVVTMVTAKRNESVVSVFFTQNDAYDSGFPDYCSLVRRKAFVNKENNSCYLIDELNDQELFVKKDNLKSECNT